MKKILVVDDNETITGVVKIILESAGYKCEIANSSKECLELLCTNKFDLILLDVAMPEVSGIDLLQHMKHMLNSNRIVLFTASTLTNTQIEHLKRKYNVLDCINKPVSKSALLPTIAKYTSEFSII